MLRVLANSQGDQGSIRGRVIPMTQKIIKYGPRISGAMQGKV